VDSSNTGSQRALRDVAVDNIELHR
jgi:hypothetical protein